VGEESYYFTVLYVVVAKVAGFEKNNVIDRQHRILPRCHHHRREVHKGFLAKIAVTA